MGILDGKRILVWQAPHFYLYDATQTTIQHPEPFEIEGLDSPGIEIPSWLAGDRVLIVDGNPAGRALAPVILDLHSRTVERLPAAMQGRAFGSIAGMLPGGEIVMRAKDGIIAYDPVRHVSTPLLPAEEDDILDLTSDGRILQVERRVLDSDLWSVTLGEEVR